MKIIAVSYSRDSGAVVPEMQWHEEIVITPNQAVLSRNGKTADSLVNSGSWKAAIDAADATRLFDRLGSINCDAMKRIEPTDEGPEGSGFSSYKIAFASGKACELFFSPGVSYSNSSGLTDPIDEFIEQIGFTEESLLQMKP